MQAPHERFANSINYQAKTTDVLQGTGGSGRAHEIYRVNKEIGHVNAKKTLNNTIRAL